MSDDLDKILRDEDRERARMGLRDVGVWGGWVVLIGTVLAVAIFVANGSQNTHHVVGVVEQSLPPSAPDAGTVHLRVLVDGTQITLALPTQIAPPDPGDTLCLRAADHRLTGHRSYVNVDDSFCS
ncbi:hypothetical protein [Pseudooctadecabacter jejudonensis]|uniref:Uncharacterized protein n=1 Tax=Pseudooctadecabacter jejudonensis TaxID=1391910 RepID=A0A1Y5RRH1_9RHOB|nr:hypothetical protein [Pseudooctadecabacter jejudonensis]SLN23409.1 hypothetical protein PSJ8397_00990 [Pseudooctadecabacter jejudonensis]